MKRFSQNLPGHVAAAAVFVVFAVYLYQPYFERFQRWEWLLPVNVCAAALGCYVLSRRWVAGFGGSLLTGLVYGFGPYMLGLARYHPTAGLLAAAVPWLFVPSAYFGQRRGKWVGIPLLLLPFLVILLFFYLSASEKYRLFAAPLQTELRPQDLAGFVAPLVMAGLPDRTAVLLGVYHVPVAALILGLAMMWKARRYALFVVAVLGFALAFCSAMPGLLDARDVAWIGVSPILWLSIPMTCCAAFSGIGLQGLIEAGYGDRKWILAAGVTLGVLAVVTLLMAVDCFQVALGLGAGYARLFVEAAKMYLLGAVAAAILFLMTRQKLRAHWLRCFVLGAALGTDIFLGARYLIDKIL
jgi:hypothetical protein